MPEIDDLYENLFVPWKIRDVEMKNKIVLCPMEGTFLFKNTKEAMFDKDVAQFFLTCAKHHAGLILMEIAPMKSEDGTWLYTNERIFQELKTFINKLHQTKAKVFIRITPTRGNAEISIDEIQQITKAFANIAKLCQKADADGVEVHTIRSGCLLDEFTLSYRNTRTDAYGGSFENRYRFLTEIVQAIKTACGEHYPVGISYAVTSKMKGFSQAAVPEEKYTEFGRDLAEAKKAAKYLQDAGYDMIEADNGNSDSLYWSYPPVYMPTNCNLDDAADIQEVVDIPIVCVGRMEPEVAAVAVGEHFITAMGAERQFLADVEWITKLMENRDKDIRPCICCQNGCFDKMTNSHVPHCALDPTLMQSETYHITPAETKKKIAIIGGGIGGMEAAILCAKRGHTVTLYEKSNRLGGVFQSAANLCYKEYHRMLIQWYLKEIKKYPIEVKLRTRVTSFETLDADEIIVATGAKERPLSIRGIEYAMTAARYLSEEPDIRTEHIVIIGGGWTGCEIAYDLFLRRKKPVIIEENAQLMDSENIPRINNGYLRDFFAVNHIPSYLESHVTEIRKKSVIVEDKHHKSIELPADTVIIATGYIPAPAFQENAHIHIIGNAKEIGTLHTVILSAWDVCMNL